MSSVRVRLLAVAAIFFPATSARAAYRKEIDAAIEKGVAYLKKSGGENSKEARDPDRVGANALVGLALLETGTQPDDPAVKKITATVRDASYTQTQTYQIALCILYLDRLGDTGDSPAHSRCLRCGCWPGRTPAAGGPTSASPRFQRPRSACSAPNFPTPHSLPEGKSA